MESSWLHRLSRRALGRRRRASVQVGLHRSATHLVAARVRLDPGTGPSIEQFETVAVGTLLDSEAIRQLAQTGILRNAPVVLVLGAEQYKTYALPAPLVPETELRYALRWQLRAVLPYAPEDAIIEFIRLTRADDSNSAHSLLAVAVARRTVALALAPLQAAGIDVQAVDIPEMAQRNLLAQLPGSGSGSALLSAC